MNYRLEVHTLPSACLVIGGPADGLILSSNYDRLRIDWRKYDLPVLKKPATVADMPRYRLTALSQCVLYQRAILFEAPSEVCVGVYVPYSEIDRLEENRAAHFARAAALPECVGSGRATRT